MKEVFESWLGVFFLALLMITGLSIISAGIDARNADAAKTSYIAEIENSNFSSEVIGAVIDDAKASGYDITVDLYHSALRSGTSYDRSVTKGIRTAAGVGDTSNVYMAKVKLDFDYSFSILNVVTPHTIFGYAR